MPESTTTSSGGSSPIRFRRVRFRIILLAILSLIAYCGSSAYDAWQSYQHAVVMTRGEISNVANALAEQTAWTWETVDLLLRDTARWYRSEAGDIPSDRLDAVLANRTAGVRQVRLVTIVDASGIQRHRSRGSSPPHLDVSDRSYFVAQRDGRANGVFMSEPLVTRSEGRVGVILSRRLEDTAGQFAGVVTAIVDLEDLEKFYGAVNLGNGGSIHLLQRDGTLLVSNPRSPNGIGRKFPALLAMSAAGPSQVTSPIDGKSAFVAVASVRDTPLQLAVARDGDVALAPWRKNALSLGVRTVALVLLGAATLAVLLRQLRRVESGERALRESEERYALAMEGANEGHWDWDLQSGRLFLSPKMKQLQGKRADTVIATRQAWVEQVVIHPDDLPRFEQAWSDHFNGRTARYECEYRTARPDGTWCWLMARGRCLRDETGQPVRFVGSAIDITASKQAQLDKEYLESQLRQSQKMEAVGTLAGGIAHDFNNILGAILGYGELAQQHSAGDATLQRYLNNVMQAAGRAKALVDRILGFSRSGLGERVLVNVQFVIEETLELLAASLPAQIRLERKLEAGDAAITGDATRLHQVAMNLCTNALQAMSDGGVLSVVLECVDVRERRPLARGALSTGPYVRLVVSDTGTGIPEAVYERMFDPFFTTKTVGEGTGLGLSLVHGIVTDLGGAIDVTTHPGAGTRFEIWLPVTGYLSAPTTEPARQLPLGAGETVMVVDDEPALVMLCEEILAELGYEPVGFVESVMALRALRANPNRFDIVLTDEAMPDLTGTALAREIRKTRADIPIVLMSGYGGPQLAERAVSIGVADVLHKPLQRRDLAESMARMRERLADAGRSPEAH
jgi:PAS domain S-box-containing protein